MDQGKIDLVVGATGLPPSVAAQLLAAAGGDVEGAVNLHFMGDDASPVAAAPPQRAAPAPTPAPLSSSSSSSRAPASQPPPFSSSSSKPAAKPAASSGSRIATLSSLGAGGDDDDDEKDDSNEYFAGGGIAMAGSGPKSGDVKKAIFKRAKELGAKEESASAAAGPKVSIVFFSDGFALETDGRLGPLRDPRAAENRDFLTALNKGEVPEELRALGDDVHVALVDRHHEPYTPPPKLPPPSFTGAGITVGSAPANPEAVYSGHASGLREVACDPSKPSTRIQIRLADGTRLVGNFNLTHTVADVYAFVRLARPDPRPFVLSTTYPRADLVAGPQAVAEAGLANATLQQRWV